MYSIEHRIDRLTLAIQRQRMEQAQPIDPLSQSLWDFADELRRLDSLDKAALLEELNRDGDIFDGSVGLDLSTDNLDRFASDFTKNTHIFLNGGR